MSKQENSKEEKVIEALRELRAADPPESLLERLQGQGPPSLEQGATTPIDSVNRFRRRSRVKPVASVQVVAAAVACLLIAFFALSGWMKPGDQSEGRSRQPKVAEVDERAGVEPSRAGPSLSEPVLIKQARKWVDAQELGTGVGEDGKPYRLVAGHWVDYSEFQRQGQEQSYTVVSYEKGVEKQELPVY